MEIVQVQERRVIVFCFMCTAGFTPNAQSLTHCRRCTPALPSWAQPNGRQKPGRAR